MQSFLCEQLIFVCLLLIYIYKYTKKNRKLHSHCEKKFSRNVKTNRSRLNQLRSLSIFHITSKFPLNKCWNHVTMDIKIVFVEIMESIRYAKKFWCSSKMKLCHIVIELWFTSTLNSSSQQPSFQTNIQIYMYYKIE